MFVETTFRIHAFLARFLMGSSLRHELMRRDYGHQLFVGPYDSITVVDPTGAGHTLRGPGAVYFATD